MKDYRSILRKRLSYVHKGVRLISDHYEDCLEVFAEVLAEAIEDMQREMRVSKEPEVGNKE